MNGVLPLKIVGNKYFTVIGGPYQECPPQAIGIRLAPEVNKSCHIYLPIRDFSIPNKADLDNGLRRAVAHVLAGEPVYVGCMAGRGRTGLFLAVLAKAFGIEDPVEYVRERYYPHAVENQRQYDFVNDYPIPPDIIKKIRSARIRRFFSFKKSLTNLVGVVD